MPADPTAFPDLLDGRRPYLEPIGMPIRSRPDELIWRRSFPGRLDQAPQARRFARFLLADAPFADDAELIVSEFAGNALRHTRSGSPDGWFTLEITVTLSSCDWTTGPEQVDNALITVYDLGGGGTPQFDTNHQPDSDEENGRGLATVVALATRVGFQGTSTTGYRVWAYLTSPDPRPNHC